VREWQLADRTPAYLWGAARVEDLDDWLARSDFHLNESEREFVAASRSRVAEQQADADERRREVARSRRFLLATAGALTVALVGVTFFVDRASSTTGPPPAPLDPGVTAERFMAAMNDRDADAAGALIGPSQPVSVVPMGSDEARDKGVTIDVQFAWQEAYDFRWDDVSCSVTERHPTAIRKTLRNADEAGVVVYFDAVAACSATVHTILDRIRGRPSHERVDLWLNDGQITYAKRTSASDGFNGRDVDREFHAWAEAERADEWAQAHNDEGPIMTMESIAVEARLVDEYVTLLRDDGENAGAWHDAHTFQPLGGRAVGRSI
jgi:hypothetical protein